MDLADTIVDLKESDSMSPTLLQYVHQNQIFGKQMRPDQFNTSSIKCGFRIVMGIVKAKLGAIKATKKTCFYFTSKTAF
jgi:hypothetical protein